MCQDVGSYMWVFNESLNCYWSRGGNIHEALFVPKEIGLVMVDRPAVCDSPLLYCIKLWICHDRYVRGYTHLYCHHIIIIIAGIVSVKRDLMLLNLKKIQEKASKLTLVIEMNKIYQSN